MCLVVIFVAQKAIGAGCLVKILMNEKQDEDHFRESCRPKPPPRQFFQLC